VYLDKEVERLGEVVHQLKCSVEDLEGPVGADIINRNLEEVSSHRKLLDAELSNISFIHDMKKNVSNYPYQMVILLLHQTNY
jgi:hypothetical protein